MDMNNQWLYSDDLWFVSFHIQKDAARVKLLIRGLIRELRL